MHAPLTFPVLRRVVRALAYLLFQLALVGAFVLRSVGALRLPFRFGNADEASQPERGGARTLPSARLRPRPAFR
ncbi:hypothetical protein [Hymenobacter canadensis]|uniref:DUF4389 domain-containing protein n=1 Tax=Hymenobacter canadensis TaxID=2999067 RepID=A0ABY7LSD6_9BACT|nr:hypothetical protein [Hymenobacter canadensis]WBA43323.1 hypothetical protein O3303_07080 [Hymenobacter canadensis]